MALLFCSLKPCTKLRQVTNNSLTTSVRRPQIFPYVFSKRRFVNEMLGLQVWFVPGDLKSNILEVSMTSPSSSCLPVITSFSMLWLVKGLQLYPFLHAPTIIAPAEVLISSIPSAVFPPSLPLQRCSSEVPN